jgi:hypothetical protein
VPKPAASPSCTPLAAQEVAIVEARIRREFADEKSAKLVVDFGCDAAARDASEIVFESGSGHGGTLELVRFRSEAGGRVTIRRLGWSHYAKPQRLTIERAETTRANFDGMLAKSRVALVARPHVVRLMARDGSIGLGVVSMSSVDFHLLLRIEDEQGRITESRFTGYASSGEKERFVPLRVATEPVTKLLEALSFLSDTATAEDRAFVTTRFLATMTTSPAWWIRERYVALVGELGTVDAVPALVALVSQKGDAGSDRTREGAIDAIARITGFDARTDENGKPRTTDEGAQRIVEECGQN